MVSHTAKAHLQQVRPTPKKLLNLREGKIAEGKISSLKIEKILCDELAEDLINDYNVNSRKSFNRLIRSIKHLKKDFEAYRAITMTSDKIEKYKQTSL